MSFATVLEATMCTSGVISKLNLLKGRLYSRSNKVVLKEKMLKIDREVVYLTNFYKNGGKSNHLTETIKQSLLSNLASYSKIAPEDSNLVTDIIDLVNEHL